MKVLVTGGAGFIGSHTVDRLVALGHQVRILDSLEKPVHLKGKPAHLNPAAEFRLGDVTRREDLGPALQGMDAVIHLAAYQDYLPDFSKFFRVNAMGTALLYELIVGEKLPVRKVVVASSQAVYGEGRHRCPDGHVVHPGMRAEERLRAGRFEVPCPDGGGDTQWEPTDEATVNPQNQYALSKHAQEQITIQLGRRYRIPSVGMRYSIVQGPRQSFYNAYSGACRVFCLALHFGHDPTIYEDGLQVRDFVNIHDVVDANLLALEDPRADYQVFNVGGGRAWTINEFARIAGRAFGKEIEPRPSGLYRFGDTRHICSDVSRLRALGWSPRRAPEASVAEYVAWLRRQENIEDVLAYAERTMKEMNVLRRVGGVRAYVLAAGLGTRMGAVAQTTPKCLLPVAGKPLLGRWFDLLAKAGVTHALVNTHHLPEPVRAYVASGRPPLEVTLAHEPVLLGSAGTLRANRAFAQREERFLVVYADNASTVDLRAFAAAHQQGTAGTLGLFRVPDPHTRGIVDLDANGTVTAFTEKPAQPKSNLAWAGLLVATPEVFDTIPDGTPCDLGHDVLPRLVGRMRGALIHGYHRDVGTPESYRQACEDLANEGHAA